MYRRLTVSRSFRLLIAKHYPGLKKSKSYWRMMQYLLFGNFFDNDNGQLLLRQETIAEIEGKKANHCYAEDFLKRFQKDVMSPDTFDWRGTWIPKEKCRTVTKFILHPVVERALKEEWLKVHHFEGRVYFDDGRKFSQAKKRAERVRLEEAAACIPSPRPETQEVREYMNAISANIYTRLISPNIPAALKVAEALPEKQRETQLRTLYYIAQNPKTIYAPSEKGNTVRIFGRGLCIPGLESDVRRTLCTGMEEADIAHSQLAIVARLWDIPAVQTFLKGQTNVWEYLCAAIDFPVARLEEIKKHLKVSLYAIIYGMRNSKVKRNLAKALKPHGLERGAERILADPLIRELFKARNKMQKKVRAAGGGYNCFGDRLSLRDFNARQILAQQAQAVELTLLLPVIRLAKTTEDFTVMVWQHDGFSVHFRRREQMWTKRINDAIAAELEKQGIDTHLEWKKEKEDSLKNIIPIEDILTKGDKDLREAA